MTNAPSMVFHLTTFKPMKRILFFFAMLASLTSFAQSAMPLKQVGMGRWDIGTGQYSGITHLGENRYAIVSDKEPADGFFIFRIDQDHRTGNITSVYLEGFHGNPRPMVDASGNSIRDCEGIAYFPPSNTLFISGEGDQKILEYAMTGQPTGRRLNVPGIFSLQNIVPNYGFESLSYETTTHRFWTTTESTLPADGPAASAAHPGVANLLRIQSFTDDLQPAAQYAYRMDRGRADDFGKIYVFGVPEITALPDGQLLVLEREANITNGYMGSECRCKLFIVNPKQSPTIDSSVSLAGLDPNHFMVKRLLADFTTTINPVKYNFANYEGMCLGRTLTDGRRTLLMISDSQGGYGKGPVHLKDYIKVIVLGN